MQTKTFELAVITPRFGGTAKISFLVLLLALTGCATESTVGQDPTLGRAIDLIERDYTNFYSRSSLEHMLLGIGVAAPLANTSADRDFQDWYQEHFRRGGADRFADTMKTFGERSIVVPIFAGATLLGHFTPDTPWGSTVFEWGSQSLRSLLVGGPPVLFWQYALGSSRPEEGNSHWHPFQDNNGVSGHGFLGAVPFLTAAAMVKQSSWHYPLLLVSFLPAWARVHENAHYLSQAALGWGLGYLSVASVDATEQSQGQVRVMPAYVPGGIGVNVVMQF